MTRTWALSAELSRQLFWVVQLSSPETGDFWGTNYSDMEGKNVKFSISVLKPPILIHPAGNKLYWISWQDKVLRCCEKETGNNLMSYTFEDWDSKVQHFIIIDRDATIHVGRNPCEKALCSHICVPTPAGYMKCLCPDGY